MSNRLTFLLSTFFVLSLSPLVSVHAQDTSYVRQPAETVVDTSLAAQYVQPLLPDKILFTQRIFWGPGGLLRVMGIAPLTTEGRKKEQKVRGIMLVTHQVTGYATLAGFLVQGILAVRSNSATGSEYGRLLNAQRTTMAITNIAYATTALLSLTAPPKLRTNQKGTSGGVRLHKYLSIIHLTGFIATNMLAAKAPQHSELKPYQQAAAFTTFAAFAPALIALKF